MLEIPLANWALTEGLQRSFGVGTTPFTPYEALSPVLSVDGPYQVDARPTLT